MESISTSARRWQSAFWQSISRQFRLGRPPFRQVVRSAGVAAALALGAASSRAASQASDAEPFEKLGTRLIELADESAGANANTSDTTMTRLAPLHDRIRLGAYELWAPLQVVDAKAKTRPGARAKDLLPRGEQLLALQAHWVDLASGDEAQRRAAREALAVVEAWWKGFGTLPHPAPPPQVLKANATLESLFGLPTRGGRYLTLIHAPSRAQYLGLVGARGQLTKRLQHELWNGRNARAPYTALLDWSTVYATTWAPVPDGAPLTNDLGMAPATLREGFVHAAAHQLVNWLIPMGPPWLLEALIVDTTITLCGADETTCGGYRETEDFAGWWIHGIGMLAYATRDKSPFRGGPSAQRFLKPLRAARAADGFMIRDIERERPGVLVADFLLGVESRMPENVVNAPLGVRKGFVEFFRAYSAAFVHYLDLEHKVVFARVLHELREAPYTQRPKAPPFHTLVEAHFGLTLGVHDDPERDLEARFRAWLGP